MHFCCFRSRDDKESHMSSPNRKLGNKPQEARHHQTGSKWTLERVMVASIRLSSRQKTFWAPSYKFCPQILGFDWDTELGLFSLRGLASFCGYTYLCFLYIQYPSGFLLSHEWLISILTWVIILIWMAKYCRAYILHLHIMPYTTVRSRAFAAISFNISGYCRDDKK